jgi:hypothetical protein
MTDPDTLAIQQRAERFIAAAEADTRRRLVDELRDTIRTVDATIARLAEIRGIRRGKAARRLTPQVELVTALHSRLATLAEMLGE